MILLDYEDVVKIDQLMNDHMYQHSISNNYNQFACDLGCRQHALMKAVNRLLKEKQEVKDGTG